MTDKTLPINDINDLQSTIDDTIRQAEEEIATLKMLLASLEGSYYES
jgi:hypothetical protein